MRASITPNVTYSDVLHPQQDGFNHFSSIPVVPHLVWTLRNSHIWECLPLSWCNTNNDCNWEDDWQTRRHSPIFHFLGDLILLICPPQQVSHRIPILLLFISSSKLTLPYPKRVSADITYTQSLLKASKTMGSYQAKHAYCQCSKQPLTTTGHFRNIEQFEVLHTWPQYVDFKLVLDPLWRIFKWIYCGDQFLSEDILPKSGTILIFCLHSLQLILQKYCSFLLTILGIQQICPLEGSTVQTWPLHVNF